MYTMEAQIGYLSDRRFVMRSPRLPKSARWAVIYDSMDRYVHPTVMVCNIIRRLDMDGGYSLRGESV